MRVIFVISSETNITAAKLQGLLLATRAVSRNWPWSRVGYHWRISPAAWDDGLAGQAVSSDAAADA